MLWETKCCECIDIISKFSKYEILIQTHSAPRHEVGS